MQVRSVLCCCVVVHGNQLRVWERVVGLCRWNDDIVLGLSDWSCCYVVGSVWVGFFRKVSTLR